MLTIVEVEIQVIWALWYWDLGDILLSRIQERIRYEIIVFLDSLIVSSDKYEWKWSSNFFYDVPTYLERKTAQE